MKTFPELPDDARAEWREDPVTQAFIAWLKGEAAAARVNVVTAMADDNPRIAYGTARKFYGAINALDLAIDIATRETFE